MKIRAIRIAEIGQFSEPVAVEGFSGGLDVLTGPNELGKSTLFNALSTLLTEKHTSSARTLAALRPDAGGTPLIEADIELDGRHLRLRKRYLAQRSAELTDLDGGSVWRGADAEGEIERLLGGEQMRALRGLVWVGQGESFDLPGKDAAGKSSAGLGGALAELIEREAADTAGAGAARRLAGEVRARLAEQVTAAHGKAKAGSELHAALRRREELEDALAKANAKAEAAEARRHRIDALRKERGTWANAATAEALATHAAQTSKAVGEAERARERLRGADERVTARQLAHDRARQEHERGLRRLGELARLREAAGAAADEVERERLALSVLEKEILEARSTRDGLAGEVDAARLRIRQVQAAALQLAARRAVADADQRLDGAHQAAAAIAAVGQRLAANPVTEDFVEEAGQLAARLAMLDARISAQAPRAAVAYLAGSSKRIRIAGREIGDGGSLLIEGITQIEIDGVGTLTIEPGDGDGLVLRRDRDTCRAELAQRLIALGADDVAGAQAALSARRREEADLAAARTRLAALAPAGIATLESERALALGHLPPETWHIGRDASNDNALGGDTAEFERRLSVLVTELAAASSHHDRLTLALREVAGRIALLEQRIGTDRKRALEIEAEMPPEAEREALARHRLAESEAAAARLAEALREREAWVAAQPDGAAFDVLALEAAKAAAAVTAFAHKQQSLEREIAELEGAMQRDGEEGVGIEIVRLEDALVAAQSRAADLELDARALQVLADRLERIGTDHRSAVLRPLVDRLQPLLGAILPGARVVLEGPLLVARIDREERGDNMGRLSGGTREQVATLVRIAYADLLAARGTPLPLLLDDALVYSDDVRLAKMVEVLAAASRRHQVVVLSCHERALDPLIEAHGGCRLVLTPWREGTAAKLGVTSARKSRAGSPASDVVT